MAKKGQRPPLGGIINVYKPAGVSSFYIVNMLRRLLNVNKIGFDGTLDPFAEGVLPLYIGRACAAIQYNEHSDKQYISLMSLGAETDSLDSTGEILAKEYLSLYDETSIVDNDCERVRNLLSSFVGEQVQEVPKFSAAKINGRRFVDLAREGKDVPTRYKKINVYKAELLKYERRLPDEFINYEYPAYANLSYPGHFYQKTRFRIEDKLIDCPLGPFFLIEYHVSSGTYIRSLNHDLAKNLGHLGLTLRLLRSKHGPFDIAKAVTLDRLESWCQNGGDKKILEANFDEILQPIDMIFFQYPVIKLNSQFCRMLLQGKIIIKFSQKLADIKESETDFGRAFFRIYNDDRFIGIAAQEGEDLRAERMFLGIEDF